MGENDRGIEVALGEVRVCTATGGMALKSHEDPSEGAVKKDESVIEGVS